jgi:hypothetical protein
MLLLKADQYHAKRRLSAEEFGAIAEHRIQTCRPLARIDCVHVYTSRHTHRLIYYKGVRVVT